MSGQRDARRPGSRTRSRWPLLLTLPLVVSGCLTMDEPEPTGTPPPTTAPTVLVTSPPRDPNVLVVGVPAWPADALPPAVGASQSLLHDLLHESLYRLDGSLRPRPLIAVAQPRVSEDGRTWTIELDGSGGRFASGRRIRASDVVGSLRIARSPTCALGRELCATALAHLEDVEAREPLRGSASATAGPPASPGGSPSGAPPATRAPRGERVVLTLDQPYAPFLTEVLAQLPILDMAAVDAGVRGIVASARGVQAGAPDALVTRIYRALGADACLEAEPPGGCRLADHRDELETMLHSASLTLPDRELFTNEMGQVDEAAYANALLDEVAALGQVLTRTGTDQQAAALGLMADDAGPFGAGPYRIVDRAAGSWIELEATPGHAGGDAGIERIRLQVIDDPAVAATALLAGDVDWLVRTDGRQAAVIEAAGRAARAARRPIDASWLIVFNTRRGRPYAEARTRQAFAACIDRDGLTAQVGDPDAVVAVTPLAPGSWAMPAGPSAPRDVTTATRLLDDAGWVVGADGIRQRSGVRLSSSVAVRASRTGVLAMIQAVAEQLRECGIELLVEDLDLTGDQLLAQLRWPNDFDTLLTMRALGADPDADLLAFEGDRIPTQDTPVDANPGGFRDADLDALLARGRSVVPIRERETIYAEAGARIAQRVPAWWMWYDTAWAAIADRVRGPDGPIDPSQPRYAWNVASWTLDPP
ncbi:MAG: hypothetical protein KF809_14335 [Chloroflexi bacterium]|nr:hypothetical protein [Chloroflexota bacterium]